MNRLRFAAVCCWCILALSAQESRLSHVATHAPAGTTASALTVGFVIGPGADQTVLIRALAADPVGGNTAAADPTLTLFDRAHAGIAASRDWQGAETEAAPTGGVPPLPAHARTAQIVASLPPGNYTAVLAAPIPTDPDSTAGTSSPVRLEIFELNPAGARLLNTSTRLAVAAGTEAVVTLDISTGPLPRRLLVRASGPALETFGISGALADPVLRLRRAGAESDLAANDNWTIPADSRAATPDALQRAFAQAGAFALAETGRDAALLADLTSGQYQVHVGDRRDAGGVALVEVYDVSPESTHGQLARRTAAMAVPAATAEPDPAIAAVEPPNHSADTDLDFRINLLELTRVVELYNTRNGTTRAGGYRLLAGTEDGFASDPNIPFDAAPVVLARYHSADTNRDGRINLLELTRVIELYNYRSGTLRTGTYVISAGSEDGFASGVQITVSIAATIAASDESGTKPGEFTVTRTGDSHAALDVTYGVGGSAVHGFDFVFLPGTVTIPAGATSAKIPLLPSPDLVTDGPDTVVLTLTSNAAYLLGSQQTATVTIADSPTALYVATLRPESSAIDSTASGTATLLLSASESLAAINVSFSNLSSEEVSAHLRISPTGEYVVGVPRGQVTGSPWQLAAAGTYTAADLLAALKSGRIYVGIDTTKYPSGELKGTFIAGTGSASFIPPADAPAPSLVATTRQEAARFLQQATFGPKKSEIDALTGQSIETWLNQQLALPFSSHRAATLADRTSFGGSPSSTNFNAIYPPNRQFAWFRLALTAPDQLRQRVAFALSQIFVISDVSLGNDNQTEPLAYYYDLLGNGAFGNFRALLENVTLSPMMGIYLSSLRNAKADPIAGTAPDENFAREVMQLFSIGLSELQPDGTLKLDAGAIPIPTYNQTTITEMAKVFTGWAYPSTDLNRFRNAPINYFSPMMVFPSFHDATQKNIVNGVVIPANLGGTEDLRRTLDALFNHPNTGPFIAKQLIQRLITSNPSPAYVYRVAQKFANNGAGVRGDLAAVVRAIYTDYEARTASVAANLAFGKLKEPLLRLTGLLRSFNAAATNGRFAGLQVLVDGAPIDSSTPLPAEVTRITTVSTGTNLSGVQSRLAQAALRAPTVFNFFSPSYVEPGPLAAAGLVAPEFQITDATTSVDVPNFLRTFVLANNVAPANPTPTQVIQASITLALDLSYEQTLVPTPSALVDHLAAVIVGGNLPTTTRDRILTALAALPSATSTLDRARTAVLLVATSPAGATQK